MHELSVAMAVVDRAVTLANGARVVSISMEVGVLACVLPDALKFCFEVAAEGTEAAGAKLEISSKPASVSCRVCQRQFHLNEVLGSCACGSIDLDWRSGRELQIVAMEMEATHV